MSVYDCGKKRKRKKKALALAFSWKLYKQDLSNFASK